MPPYFHRRLQKEIKTLIEDPLENIRLVEFKDIRNLKLEITGSSGTLYEDEKYILFVKIPESYPIDSPEVIFSNTVPLNEHVYSNGHICLSILYDQWSPALTIKSVCLSIISLLSSARAKKKPANDKLYCRISQNRSPKSFKWEYESN
ncbi:ubiquitin-conjugating enzyme [Hamiltosporidium magnivora]|uniref:Ubiquitin-conjugating enzyme n=1 Tax=Hamiltosporidium magnivora TaxID=148818 RepID=A0A4V2JVZ9_9MICR|nr:ubiquitin-conjugating enzyme [Hamiltosporidium magnivora]TBU07563.1 ubiquitin-conjugating enzyme [Hamiltosporidium magnivora]